MPKHPFEYHKPTDEQVEKMKIFNDIIREAYDYLLSSAPESAERTIVFRHLQYAIMMYNASLVLNDYAVHQG